MNGKNRKVRGCYSRVSRSYGFTPAPEPPPPPPPPKLYTLPKFTQQLKNNCSLEQRQLLEYFENFGHHNISEEYSYNSNTPRRIIKLRQNHFNNGTVRITVPGIYVLQENIIFNPNESNDFFPTGQQMAGQYPVGNGGAYHLGFFAAITVEVAGVILDLNNFTMSQSQLHTLQQRFYSHIELASAPFIPRQGPGSFSSDDTYSAANSLLIRNGKLGKSSHHGIHGNAMKNIVLDKLEIFDFEVAGIALNGTDLGIINNINIRNVSEDIPVVSSYSQARFIRSFLPKILTNHTSPTINIEGNTKTYQDISTNLHTQLNIAKESIINSVGDIPSLFKNNTGLYDGNVYGMVLNEKGVVINGFIRDRVDAVGNKKIYLQDVSINRIISQPVEIIGLNTLPESQGAYGAKMQAGPAGDILDISNVQTETRTYKPNVLADSEIFIAKYNNPKIGTTSIHQKIVEWVEQQTDLSGVMSANGFYFVDKGDSMGHTMKGNIGLFISAGIDIKGNNINITNIISKGTNVGTSPLISGVRNQQQMQGATSNGVLFTGSTNIEVNGSVSGVSSDSGNQYSHDLYSISGTNIKFNGSNVSNNE